MGFWLVIYKVERGIKVEGKYGINQYLNKDEQVLWAGYPQANFIFTIWDMFYFSIGALCIWPLINRLLTGRHCIFEVGVIILFITFILFFFMVGRVLMRYYIRKRTIYFVTSERIVIFNSSNNRIVKKQDIKSIKRITKKIGRNGIGRVEFGKISIAQLVGENSGFDELAETKFAKYFTKINTYFDDEADQMIPVFYDIRDYEHVYDLVNGLKNSGVRHNAPPRCQDTFGRFLS